MKNFTKFITPSLGTFSKNFSTSSLESSHKGQCEIYKAEISSAMQRLKEEADKKGKNILFLLGNIHDDKNATFAQSLFFQSAKNIGISSYLVEAAPMDAKHLENDLLKSNQFKIFYFFATKYLSLNPIFCDLDIPLDKESVKSMFSYEGIFKREENFCDVIKKHNQSAIMNVGDLHLKALATSPILRGNFDILPIAINYEKTQSSDPLEKERDDFLSQGQMVFHMKTPIFQDSSPWKILSYTLKDEEMKELVKLAKKENRLSKTDIAEIRNLEKSDLVR